MEMLAAHIPTVLAWSMAMRSSAKRKLVVWVSNSTPLSTSSELKPALRPVRSRRSGSGVSAHRAMKTTTQPPLPGLLVQKLPEWEANDFVPTEEIQTNYQITTVAT